MHGSISSLGPTLRSVWPPNRFCINLNNFHSMLSSIIYLAHFSMVL
uniref:Uncharacterized protein n=1 Tax=Anguilla anguilla TaxID=7936 RepID=A0A0E9WUL2_ANGAN